MSRSMEELVCLAQKNDEEAIAALYEQTYNSVYQSVRAVIKDEDEALDIVQDSYIKGFQNLSKLEDPAKYQAWMKRLASNMAIDYLRKKKPVLLSERIDEDGEEIDLRHQDDCLEHMPEEVIDRQETTRLMNDILGTLKAEQRLAVVMYYYEEMSVREIAETLGCSENTVKSRLKYARDKIEVEVRKLEKKGTKLYSLAPMSFFIWLLRMAKENGISFVQDGADAGMAVGTAAAAAGSTASGSAAGAAVKVAGGVAGKTLATKIIASTLAVTMTLGIGAVAVNNINKEKENEEAHAIYEEFLGRYKAAWDMGAVSADINRFWEEISEDILEQNPDIDLGKTNSWYLDYTPGEDLDEGIPVPDTMYDPNMHKLKLLSTNLESEEVRAAYYDLDGNGIDDLVIAQFYRGKLCYSDDIDVYAVRDGKLYRGVVDWGSIDGKKTWEIRDTTIADYIDPGIIYIRMGKGYFDEPFEIDEPELDWKTVYGVGVDDNKLEDEIPTTEATEPPVTEDPQLQLIESMAGSYRYEVYLHQMLAEGMSNYTVFHNFSIIVTDEEIIIEDLGEPQESIDNRNAFIQEIQEDGYKLKPEEIEYLYFDNMGTMRIDRSSIQFIDSGIFTFDGVGFEGSTAPSGKVNKIDFRGGCFFMYYHNSPDPHNTLVLSFGKDGLNYLNFACFEGIVFHRNST